MIKIFTQDDVLLYIYKELPSDEQEELEDQLCQDHELLTFYQQAIHTLRQIPKSEIPVPESCVQNIMQYARKYK